MVRTRLIINVGSTNRTLPNENFKAYERLKKSGPRGAPKLFAVMLLKKELRSLPKKRSKIKKQKGVQNGRLMIFIESVCDKKLPKSSILQNLILNLFLAMFSYFLANLAILNLLNLCYYISSISSTLSISAGFKY